MVPGTSLSVSDASLARVLSAAVAAAGALHRSATKNQLVRTGRDLGFNVILFVLSNAVTISACVEAGHANPTNMQIMMDEMMKILTTIKMNGGDQAWWNKKRKEKTTCFGGNLNEKASIIPGCSERQTWLTFYAQVCKNCALARGKVDLNSVSAHKQSLTSTTICARSAATGPGGQLGGEESASHVRDVNRATLT
ncbi:MAG: hypothetical protein FRX49_07346 [Trebouxia sp. A1-2]|nr:MAG: hypothetical protein FRX49_07346 [Trebouxia sp. A1-2]